MKKVTQYGIKCVHCWQEIYSNYRHDFKHCFCETIFIDGGHRVPAGVWTYERVGFHKLDDYITCKRKVYEVKNERKPYDTFPY